MTSRVRRLGLLGVVLAGCAADSSRPAVEGRIDLRDWRAELEGPVRLDGAWRFAPGVLLPPDADPAAFPELLSVPGTWSSLADPQGVSSYHLQILLPDHHPALLLRTGPVSTACDLWIDGREVPCPGEVSTTLGEIVPSHAPTLQVIPADHGGRLELLVHVANREHRVGGLRRSWTLGEASSFYAVDGMLNLVHALGGLLLAGVGVAHLLLFGLRPREQDKGWFGAFALSMGIRALFAGDGRSAALLLDAIPWAWQLRLEYLATGMIVLSGVGLLRVMFPAEDAALSLGRHSVLRLVQVAAGVVVVVSVPLVPLAVGGVFAAQNVVMSASILATPIVLLAAARADRPLARWMLVVAAIFLVGAVHDILRARDLVHTPFDLAPAAFTGVVILHSLALARQFASSYTRIERLSEDLSVAHHALEATHRAVVRFVPFEFISMLQRQSIREVVRGDHVRLEMEILFADIRSFTTLVEAIAPERAFELINEYFQHMEPAIHAEGGFVTQYLGDGIMALYATGADAAVRSAVAMQAALVELNRHQTTLPGTVLRIGIGINRGPVMLGTIGGHERLSANVIGDPVNTAARLEGMTRLYGATLVIGESTVAALQHPEQLSIRELDRVLAKGKHLPMRIFEVLDGLDPAERAGKLKTRERFGQALAAWRAGDFTTAREGFSACLTLCPGDAASRLYVERCDHHLAHPPTGAWDGTTLLTSK